MKKTKRAASAGAASTREKILEVAEAMIAENGVEGFQIKQLASALGIRPPSLFAHFEGRNGIIEAVSNRLLDRIAEAADTQDVEDPVECLRRRVSGIVGHLAENRTAALLILRDLGSPAMDQNESTRQRLDSMQEEMAKLLRRGVRKGVFRKVRTEAVMAQLVGAATANVVWLDDGAGQPPGLTVRKLQRETTELILRYVASDAELARS